MRDGRVLITGGAGFIGARIAEIYFSRNMPVRVGIRTWKSAARVGRLPVEIVPCDVMDSQAVATAMAGVTEVIHCARGDGHVNVEGTRNVLRAAAEAGVRRVVQLSTVSVYGDVVGEVDEQTGVDATNEYGRSKIEAEQLCAEFQASGLSTCVLRPTIVYGPFSDNWVIEYAQRFVSAEWQLPRSVCGGTCNLIYVDDLVELISLACTRPEADGETFIANGRDRPTWWEYFEALNSAMGRPPLENPDRSSARRSARLMMPVRKTAKFLLAHFEREIMAVYQRSDVMKRVMRQFEEKVRNTPTTNEFELYSREVSFSADRAARLLGYAPQVDMTEGVKRSAAWLAHHRYV